MVPIVLTLIPVAAVIAAIATRVLISIGHATKTYDNPGVRGQVKDGPRPVPNTGGIAIFLAIAAPTLAIIACAIAFNHTGLPRGLEALAPHLEGMQQRLPLATAFLASLLILHITGLIDDRRPLPWLPKLLITLAIPAALATFFDTRLLSALDVAVGGPWLSILITVLWFAAITNAMNFMDNMDGLAAGTAAVAALTFMTAALIQGQWFVAAGLALLIGANLGFLVFNFPEFGHRRAEIYMGDAGSLILGFALAFLTTRTTYYDPSHAADTPSVPYATLMPLLVLAVPLYDLTTVTIVRLAQGQSPFVGDLQHFSHRLVRRGVSRRAAVVLIWTLTAITSISGIALPRLEPWQAALTALQVGLTLAAVAIFEARSSEKR